VGDVKESLMNASDEDLSDLTIIYKGKKLQKEDLKLCSCIPKNTKTVKLIASGISRKEADVLEAKSKKDYRIRDDLTREGQMQIAKNKAIGLRLQLASKRHVQNETAYGFGKAETLAFLPNEMTAKEILRELMNDEGILSCMRYINGMYQCWRSYIQKGM